jgi:hypothetical protein
MDVLLSQGPAAKQVRIVKAYVSIYTTVYRGQRHSFKFSDYVMLHQEAHNELFDLNEMDAGIKIEDVPMQYDSASSHSIKVNDVLEITLEMHGVISHIRTRLPTEDELENYRQG